MLLHQKVKIIIIIIIIIHLPLIKKRMMLLIHVNFGVKEKDVAEAARLSEMIADVMAPNGVLISGQPLVGFEQVRGPETVAPERYYFYRT